MKRIARRSYTSLSSSMVSCSHTSDRVLTEVACCIRREMKEIALKDMTLSSEMYIYIYIYIYILYIYIYMRESANISVGRQYGWNY